MSKISAPDPLGRQGEGDVDAGGGDDSSCGSSVFRDDLQVLISSHNNLAMLSSAPNYKKVHTVWLSVLMLLLAIAALVVASVIPEECEDVIVPVNMTAQEGRGHKYFKCWIPPVSVIMYLQCCLWSVFLICDQFIRYQQGKIRRRGYLDFYNSTSVSSQLPFWVVSTFSVMILAVSTVLLDHCKTATTCAKSIHLTRAEYLTVCIGLEIVVLLVVISYYLYQVVNFNRSKNPPDVFRDDMLGASSEMTHNTFGQIDEELFQRQADLIKYFKERNTVLQRAVLHLNNQLAEAQSVIQRTVNANNVAY